MLRADTSGGTVGATEDHGRAHLAAGHVERLGRGVDDLIHRLHGEVEGHELDNRAQTAKGRANTDPGKAMFGDRRVDHPFGAEFVQHPLGDFIGALVLRDFFAHEEDIFVAAHLFGHGITQRFADGLLLHRRAFGPVGAGVGLGLFLALGGGLAVVVGGFGLRRLGVLALVLGGGRCRAVDIVRAFAFFQQNGDSGVHLHAFGAFLDQDLADGAFVNGFEFHRGLVGFDLGQNVTRRDFIAFLDQPFGQRAFFHGRAEGGHKNFGCHISFSPQE